MKTTNKSILRALACVLLIGASTKTFATGLPPLQDTILLGGKQNSSPNYNDNSDLSACIVQTLDGGFIAVGSSNSNDADFTGNHGPAGYSDVAVVKLNASHDTVWVNLYGSTSEELGKSLVVCADGSGYVISATTTCMGTNGDVSGNAGSNGIWVFKINTSGVIQWQIVLGGTQSETAQAGSTITQLRDGDYVVCGQTGSTALSGYHGGSSDGYVVRLSPTGSIVGSWCIGSNVQDFFTSIDATSDSGYVLLGYTNGNNNQDVPVSSGSNDFWTVKMSKTNTISWKKCAGGSNNDMSYCIKQTLDGGYIMTGSTKGNITGYQGGLADVLVAKMTSAGSLSWMKCRGGTGDDRGYSIAILPDSGFVVCGQTTAGTGDVTGGNYHASNDMWVFTIDKTGNLTAQNCYGGSSTEFGMCVIRTTDGGYAIFGHTNSNMSGDVGKNHRANTSDWWIVWLSNSPIPPVPPIINGPVPIPPSIDKVVPVINEELMELDGGRRSSPFIELNTSVPVQTLKVYYNQENLVITKPTNESEVTIYDLSGRVIENFNYLKPGIYIAISIEPDQSSQKCKFIVN